MSRFLRKQNGASLVEFAIILPIYIVIIIGIIESGRLIFNYNLISTAVRDGARWAAVRGKDSFDPTTRSEIQSRVSNLSLGTIPAVDISCNPVTVSGCNDSTPGVRVEVLRSPDEVCSGNACLWANSSPINAKYGFYVRVFAQIAIEPIMPFLTIDPIILRSTATMLINR